MAMLVETHTCEEIKRIRKVGAKVIGTDARNLENPKASVNKYNEFVVDLPDNVIKVAESGVFDAIKVEGYVRAGADAILVDRGMAIIDNYEFAVKRLVKAEAQMETSGMVPLSEYQESY